jgi:hypothetical protein
MYQHHHHHLSLKKGVTTREDPEVVFAQNLLSIDLDEVLL